MNWTLQFAFATVGLLLTTALGASELTGKVVSVSDGDTLRVLVEDQQIKIRLGGIDAPESDQPFGQASKRYLAKAVAGQTVVVEFEKKDRYGRVIGKVLLDGTDMNLRQVKAGYAWWYEYYKRDQSGADQQAYAAAEQQAKDSGIGLWSEPAPINPYDWRQGKRNLSQVTEGEPFQCGEKQYCKEMFNCAEAKFHLASCGLTKLDGDGDGMPCESLCR
ncbi:thermonuclease family protein [Luminiphilus sp.]|nr:thermonuclease family protein [Luminiphilus sp.]